MTHDFFLLEPFLADETVLFDETRKANLLFKPNKILALKSANENICFKEGLDYDIDYETGVISLYPDSRINSLQLYGGDSEMYQRFKNQQGQGILFSEGHFFHDHQVKVIYRHQGHEWDGQSFIPKSAVDKLPLTISRLRNDHITVDLFGDSISAGANASAKTGVAPYQEPYGDLLIHKLEHFYDIEVTFNNHSVGGKSTPWGVENIQPVIDDLPDLVILAFGMNDATAQHSKEYYKTNNLVMIDKIRQNRPETEFILVANMLSNPDWSIAHHEFHWDNLVALTEIAEERQGVVVADIMSLTKKLFDKKKFADFTGNNVNHPNDFLHRVYAEFLYTMLIP